MKKILRKKTETPSIEPTVSCANKQESLVDSSITVGMRRTVNLGNYESAVIEMSLTLPLDFNSEMLAQAMAQSHILKSYVKKFVDAEAEKLKP